MNKKLEQAIQILNEQQVSCVMLIDGTEPICSNDIGIKPLMTPLRKDRHFFAQGVIADKVIGKAAALMLVLGNASAVYGEVMSESAKNVLEQHHITYAYHTIVPYIENRTQTGKCPLEQAVWDIENPEEAFDVLEQTIQQLMQAKK